MKQEIAQIRATYDQEDNKIPVKVESSLKKIEKAYGDFQGQQDALDEKINKQEEDYGKLYKESKKRQTKSNELEREVQDKQDEIDRINSDKSHDDYEELKKYKADNEVLLVEGKVKTRKQFIERQKELKDHDDWDKAKDSYILPEEKDGNYDFKDISDDDMVKNANKLKEQEGYGLFGGKTTTSVNTEKSTTTKVKEDDPYKDKFN